MERVVFLSIALFSSLFAFKLMFDPEYPSPYRACAPEPGDTAMNSIDERNDQIIEYSRDREKKKPGVFKRSGNRREQ
ncbi:hypothetical protein RB195_016865 [Necator americanus]|uniref:Uncharacterized protein n=1 Tax=Necator americanus TaxID=51031 RepID=A0ABR1C2I1_NECAM